MSLWPLSEDRRALKGSPAPRGWVPNTAHTGTLTRALGQRSIAQLLSCSGLEESGDGNGSGCVALCSQAGWCGGDVELKFLDCQCFSSHPCSVALAVFGRAEMVLQSHGPRPFPQERFSGVHSHRWKCHFPVLYSTFINITVKGLTELFWWSFTKYPDLFHSPQILEEWCKSQFCTGLAVGEHYESIWYFVLTIALLKTLTYILQLSL